MNRSSRAASTLLAGLLSATVLASADAASAAPTAHSAHAQARASAYTVDAHVNRTEPLVGSTVKVKGAVSPAAPGAEVRLQVKYAGQGWKNIDSTRLTLSSRFKFKDEVSTVRERRYRVVKPGDRRRAAGQGRTEKVTVYGWRSLSSVGAVLRENVADAGTVAMNAVAYPDSMQAAGTAASGRVDYNLNRDCTALDAVYGLADTSPSGSTASLTVVADGVTRHTGSYGLTQAQRVPTDVTGVFRLSILTSQTGGGLAAVGTPRVLCSF